VVIAFIPARGGSKGVKNKNLQRVGGKSLVGRSIECAFSAGVTRIYVSTDSDEIAIEARNNGAIVIKRPDDISGDSATTESSIEHFLKVENFSGEEIVVLLQATSPFTNSFDVKKAISRIKMRGKNIFSAIRTDMFQWKEFDNKWIEMSHDRFDRKTRQNFGALMLETGNFYIFTVQNFNVFKSRFSDDVEPFEIDSNSIHQIDSLEDLEIAQSMVKIRELNSQRTLKKDLRE
jgi:CMP-N-acetylneuraminic acid synthetase